MKKGQTKTQTISHVLTDQLLATRFHNSVTSSLKTKTLCANIGPEKDLFEQAAPPKKVSMPAKPELKPHSGKHDAAQALVAESFNSPEIAARHYVFNRYIGSGSFGVVALACNWKTGEQVAIKKVDQDPKYKNRELDIMKELNHPNIIQLRDYYYEDYHSEDSTEVRRKLNVVMDYIPDTVHRVLKEFAHSECPLPMTLVRLYMYQLCRSVGFLHNLGICHRDIKPQNLLVDLDTHVLKLCDFGSAKRLVKSEQSVAYICSRFYRAPELMLGSTNYTTAIDLWSVGCVFGEMLLTRPLFPGQTAVDQFVRIIRVLGSPTKAQMTAMNPNFEAAEFPRIDVVPWKQFFNQAKNGICDDLDDNALSLLSQFLCYDPNARIKAYQALAHPFFDPLRQSDCKTLDNVPFPDLFNFTPEERAHLSPALLSRIIPPWYSESKCSTDKSGRSISPESTTDFRPAHVGVKSTTAESNPSSSDHSIFELERPLKTTNVFASTTK